MSDHLYILDEQGEPVAEPNTLVWARWFETSNRLVRHTHAKSWVISTIFLATDHGWGLRAPILWETMVFPADPRSGRIRYWDDYWCTRYSSRAEALKGHARIVGMVRRWQKRPRGGR